MDNQITIIDNKNFLEQIIRITKIKQLYPTCNKGPEHSSTLQFCVDPNCSYQHQLEPLCVQCLAENYHEKEPHLVKLISLVVKNIASQAMDLEEPNQIQACNSNLMKQFLNIQQSIGELQNMLANLQDSVENWKKKYISIPKISQNSTDVLTILLKLVNEDQLHNFIDFKTQLQPHLILQSNGNVQLKRLKQSSEVENLEILLTAKLEYISQCLQKITQLKLSDVHLIEDIDTLNELARSQNQDFIQMQQEKQKIIQAQQNQIHKLELINEEYLQTIRDKEKQLHLVQQECKILQKNLIDEQKRLQDKFEEDKKQWRREYQAERIIQNNAIQQKKESSFKDNILSVFTLQPKKQSKVEYNKSIKFEKLIEDLYNKKEIVEELKIYQYNCNIMSEGALQIGIVLSHLKKLVKLELYLGANNLNGTSIVDIMQGVYDLKDTLTFFALGVSENQIEDGGVNSIAQIIGQLKEVNRLTLYISDCFITSKGVWNLINSIQMMPKLKVIEYLQLSGNGLVSEKDKIKKALANFQLDGFII